MGTVQEWNELAAQLAVDSIRCSTAAGSGHPTSSMSAAHLIAVLYTITSGSTWPTPRTSRTTGSSCRRATPRR